MKKTFTYLKILFRINLKKIIQYRSTFFAGIVSTILWALLAVFSISIITYQAPEVGGWNIYELVAVQGVYSLIFGIVYIFLGANIKNLGNLVRLGDLDLIFIKPMDGQLLVSLRDFQFHHLARVLIGILLITFSLIKLNLSIDILHFLLFLVFAVSSIVVIYSLWFGLMTLSFWVVDLFNLWEFMTHLTGITRYPLEILQHLGRFLLYVLMPLVVITSVPAQVIVNKFNLELAIWSIFTAVFLFILTRKFWQFALKHYTSASS